MKLSPPLFFCGLAALAASCSTNNPVATAATQTVEAHDFLLRLHDQRQLPGDSKNTEAAVASVGVTSQDITYPLFRTFHVSLSGETFTNNYVVTRTSKSSSWQLVRAWRTDSAGHTLEEWKTK